MADRQPSGEHSLRALLSRHPIAVEVVQTVADIAGSVAEVIVFEDGRGFVVAASTSAMMQPRRLTCAESVISERSVRAHTDGGTTSYALIDDDGVAVGALSVGGVVDDRFDAAIHAQARVLSLVVALANTDTDAQDSHASAVLHGLRDAVVVLDSDLKMKWVNRATGSLLGRSPVDIVGRDAADFLHPDDLEPTLNAILRLNAGLEIYRIKVRVLRSDGDYELVEVTALDHSNDPTVGGIVLSLRNANVDGEAALLRDRSDRMADAVVGGLSDGVVATDEFGAITLVNDVARRMFALDGEAPPASFDLSDFVVVDHDSVPIDLARDTRLEFTRSFDLGLHIASESPERCHLTINRTPVVDSHGDQLGSVVVFRNVTALKEAAASLRHQALHDQLTGLPNRRQLEERISGLEADVTTNVAACFIDLDGFKLINDNHGHSTGDQLIKIAARRLEKALRPSDLLVRQGGDEFVALQIGASNVGEVLDLAERLRLTLARPFTIDNRRFDMTASIGVSMATSDNADGETLLQQADIALYAAKTRGRNRVETFDQELADAVAIEASQQQFLRDALREQRLVMHFQPLVASHNEQVNGYEALARVRTPEGDIVGPASFLAANLPSDLMYAFDSAAFDLSCTATAELAKATPHDPPYVSCNLSPTTLAHPDLVQMVNETVARHGIEPSQICLEVTESAAFSSGPAALESLTRLHRSGFRVALDDFGTGYSSLVHLRDLPIDVVKVDRSFVIRLADHGSERAIVTAITALARNLGLGLVAEGVETAEHLEHAQQIGFDTMQGWYYAKAMPLEAVLAPQLVDAPA